ncbi:hypothetical protein MD484_g4751, partial [Candolleomyces efflorescens]
MDDEPIEFLVSRRSKRSTAGNRMQAALAEMAAENLTQEVEDDNDFTVVNDEQDVFESDFESTDEEEAAEKDGEEAGEQMVHEEERRERKAARSRLEKATAAAHARNKATFNPQAAAPTTAPPKPRLHPRFEDLSDDLPVASTSSAGGDSSLKRKRKSLRTQTVLNTTATVQRLKEIEHNKALAPKKAKTSVKTYTQAELIARALDNEEGNIRDHRDYLKNEEEKRKQARVERATVKGPVLRWVSRVEEVKVVVRTPSPDPAPPPPPPLPKAKVKAKPIPPPPLPPSIPAATPAPYTLALPRSMVYPPGSYPVSTTYYSPQQQQQLSSSAYTQVQPYNSTFIFQTWPQSASNYAMPSPPPPPPPEASAPPPPAVPVSAPSAIVPMVVDPEPVVAPAPAPPAPAASTEAEPQPEPEPEYEKVGRNYIVHAHDLSKSTSGSGNTTSGGNGSASKKKPTWNETMQAMFGKEVKWDELKVYTSKNRPISRIVQSCPITGKSPAPYKDPKTNSPFADVTAYKVLMELLEYQHIWSPKLGRYVGTYEVEGAGAGSQGQEERVGEGSGWPRREEEEEGEEEGGDEVQVQIVRKERLGGRLRAL